MRNRPNYSTVNRDAKTEKENKTIDQCCVSEMSITHIRKWLDICRKQFTYRSAIKPFTMKKTLTSILFSLFFILIFSRADAQQQAERLVAKSIYLGSSTHTFQPWDSVFYIYGGNRYMDSPLANIFYPTQAYDTAYGWDGGATGSFDTLAQKILQTYNAAGQMITDTILNWNDSAQTYFYAWYDTITYNSTGLPLTVVAWRWNTNLNMWVNYWIHESAYDASGRRLEYVELLWDTAANIWDTSRVSHWTYNGAGQISSEYEISNPHLSTGIGFLYSYDSLGRVDSTTLLNAADSLIWLADGLEAYTYDSLGRLTVLSQLIPDSTGWENHQRRVYIYNSANDMVLMLNQVSEPSGWTNWIRQLYSYDAYHHDTLDITQDTSAGRWINSSRYQAAYDSYGLITWSATTAWDTAGGGSWLPNFEDNMYFYYYQLYTPDTTVTTGVATTESQADLRIYPVPAADMLSLDVKWQEAQPATAAIYDVSGRKYTEWQLPNALSYHGYVPLSMLPAGAYILSIKGTSGTISRSFDVMR